jgi:fructose-1,6-bisphosphatase/inositol monophosphatase family enzyme
MDQDRRDDGITRREFHWLGSSALVAAFVAGWVRRAATEPHELVTDIAANKALLEGIQYVNESKKEGQHCANCVLYSASEGGLGKCQLFPQGFVKQTGWCMSWSARP